MKKSMILLGMLSIGYAYAQEERVGINTETPSATLNVKTKTDATSPKNLELENQAGIKLMTVLNKGNVGLNNDDPTHRLDIKSIGDGYSNNSIALRVFSNSQWGGAFDFFRARGTSDNPLVVNKSDDLGAIHSRSYTGFKYLTNSKIATVATGDITTDNVPSSIVFETTNVGSKLNRIMTLHHTSNIAIGAEFTPKATLDIHANNNALTNTQKEKGKNEVILLRNIHVAPVDQTTKESRLSIAGGMNAFGIDYRSHSIDFGMIDLNTATRPFMAFSVAPYQGAPTNEDKTVEHMRIMHTGNIGIGTTAPTHKLHIKANTNPLKLEGLQESTVSTDKILVADENGVVKTIEKSSLVSAPTSTDAVQVGSTTSMTCNDANRGKMNFVKDVTIGSGTGDAFAVCLKGTDGKYYWRYLYGAAGMSNLEGNFGTGL